MRKLLLITGIVSALSLSVPIDLSFANTQTKKQVVQGKAKQVNKKILSAKVSSKKILSKVKSRNKVVQGKAKQVNKKILSTVVYKRPRYAKNINKPQEGELLKLEGMIKDLNEQ